MASSFCSSQYNGLVSVNYDFIYLEIILNTIHGHLHVHVDYLNIIFIATCVSCTSDMCEPQHGHILVTSGIENYVLKTDIRVNQNGGLILTKKSVPV